jgi:BRCT domain type II-containing protein
MANKDQKRGNRETRKPKQNKAPKAVATASPFTTPPSKSSGSGSSKHK